MKEKLQGILQTAKEQLAAAKDSRARWTRPASSSSAKRVS